LLDVCLPMKNVKTTHQDSFFEKRREPFQFMLQLAMVGMGILFFILTLLFATQYEGETWQRFDFPPELWFSTLAMVISSFTLHQANISCQSELFKAYRLYLCTTFLLGVIFMLLQVKAWQGLHQQGYFIQKNNAAIFLYMITALHIVHLLAGMIGLLYECVKAFQKTHYVDAFIYSVNPPNQLRLKLITLYWHFVDAVWIYLFLFIGWQYQ
jgi:cytochrome c oxidase subunit III